MKNFGTKRRSLAYYMLKGCRWCKRRRSWWNM